MDMVGDVPLLRIREATVRKGAGRSRAMLAGLSLDVSRGEHTAGLDLVARHRFLETVRGLTRRGKTIIFVTHQLHEIIPEVKRVVLLRQGTVFLNGPKHEVLTGANLSAAFGAPLQVETGRSGYYSVLMTASPEPASPGVNGS